MRWRSGPVRCLILPDRGMNASSSRLRPFREDWCACGQEATGLAAASDRASTSCVRAQALAQAQAPVRIVEDEIAAAELKSTGAGASLPRLGFALAGYSPNSPPFSISSIPSSRCGRFPRR